MWDQLNHLVARLKIVQLSYHASGPKQQAAATEAMATRLSEFKVAIERKR
jgi:hypothetical protein